jgi:hypothetical protein
MVRSGVVAARALLRQPGRLKDAVHLRLAVGHQCGDVLDETALLPLGDDRGGQFLAGGLHLGIRSLIGTCGLPQPRKGFIAHDIHDGTSAPHCLMIHGKYLRCSLAQCSPSWYIVAETKGETGR